MAIDQAKLDEFLGRFVADRYHLSEEQAYALADETSPAFVPGAFQLATSTIKDEPRITEAVRSGDGLGWHQHHADLWQGTERFFRPGYAANLVSSWIPALDGVEAKLRAGARVADVGCGHGASTILLAKAYPRSSFTGFDYHDRSIEWARKAAAEAGVGNRAGFEVAPADAYPGEGYDLVAVFDALHDMGDPLAAAAHIRARWPTTAPSCWSSRPPASGWRTTSTRWAGSSTRPRCSSACPTPAPRAGPASAARSRRPPGARC